MSDHAANKRATTGGGSRPIGAARSTTGATSTWTGSADQIKFRGKVLKEAIDDRVKRGRRRFANLKDDELAAVKNSGGVNVKSEAAKPASDFLKGARDALQAARKAADRKSKTKDKLTTSEDDVLLTLDIQISGYRSVEREKQLWRRYFGGYYNRTSKSRGDTGDPHGAKAVTVMVRFISPKKAPPGFSKHTLGVSVDFYQKRKIGKNITWIKNSTKKGKTPGHNSWWYSTWLYSWLHKNAPDYGFKELSSEAWHYDYVGKKR